MTKKKLHPSVEEFKQFIKEHTHLIQLVRKGEYTWQELYEDWYLLGADDPRWQEYSSSSSKKVKKEESNSNGWWNQISGLLKNMDAKQVDGYIEKLNEAISSVQGVLSQFQSQRSEDSSPMNQERNDPFSFRKD